VNIGHQKVMILAEEVTRQRKHDYPDARPQSGKGRKEEEVHARKAGRKGYVLADTRQESAYKGADMSMAGEKEISPVKGLGTDEEVTAVFFEKRSAELDGKPVIEGGAQKAPSHAAGNDKPERHVSSGGQIAGGRYHNLTGKGEKRGFQEHQGYDARIPPVGDCL
jgi:hypothetical protein